MAGTSRDRVTIDLRAIGDGVRAAADMRGISVARLAREAIVSSLTANSEAASMQRIDHQNPDRSTVKLTLRLPRPHAEALILNAGGLGLSYGEYVARLVNGSALPQPLVERVADRAALMASTDHLATLSADLNALAALLRQGSSEKAQAYRHRLETANAEIRHHLDRVSALIANL